MFRGMTTSIYLPCGRRGSVGSLRACLCQSSVIILLAVLALASCDRARPADNGRGATSVDATGSFFPKTPAPIVGASLDSGYTFTGVAFWREDSAWVARASLRLPHQWAPTAYRCLTPLVAPDTLEVHCPGTPLGEVVVTGHFTSASGRGQESTRSIQGAAFVHRSGEVMWSWRGLLVVEVTHGD